MSFEQILGLFIIENQTPRAFRAMKEFIILHPTCFPSVLSPPRSGLTSCHTHSRLRPQSTWAGQVAAFPPGQSGSQELQTTLHAHTCPSDWDGASKDENGQLRRKLDRTALVQAYLSGGLLKSGEGVEATGRTWVGAQTCPHSHDELASALPCDPPSTLHAWPEPTPPVNTESSSASNVNRAQAR